MNAPQWDDLAASIRAYCKARWNAEPLRIQIDLANFGSASLPMPSWEARITAVVPSNTDPPTETPAPAVEPVAGNVDVQTGRVLSLAPVTRILEDRHTDDYQIIIWQGVRYTLTPKQSKVVRALWEAWNDGQPDVSQAELLRAADSDGVRLVDLFRRSACWQNLVVSVKQGYYRLSSPDLEITTEEVS